MEEETFQAIHDHYLKFNGQDFLHEREKVEKVIESLVLGLLFLVSFLANGIICIVLLQESNRQTASNIFLFSLVLANFLISVLFVPFVIVSVVTDEWLFGTIWCEISGFLVNSLFAASNLSIVAIAIHRYYFVVKPLALKVDVHRARFVVRFLWFSSLTCAVSPLFGWNSYSYSPGKAQCTLAWKSGGSALVYSIYYVLTTFFIPLGIILSVYKAVYSKAKKQRKLGVFILKKTGTNGYMSRGISSQSIEQRRMMCGCFPGCIPVHNNNFYMQRNPMISSISSTSFSFDSSSQSIPGRQNANERKEALRRQVSRHSSVIQQRTFQRVSAIVISFIVCLSPYFVVNLWSLFKQTTPHHILDFVTSWLYLCMTAVNPMTYGYSNRQIRLKVKRLPLVKRFFKQGRDRAYQMDPTTYHRITARRFPLASSQRNQVIDNES